MVLFDSPINGIDILLNGCKYLKKLSLVVDRTSIMSLAENAEKLSLLKSFELTWYTLFTKVILVLQLSK